LTADEGKSLDSLAAESYYRQDRFDWAAGYFRAVGKEAKAIQLESFKGLIPNQISPKNATSRIPFVVTDPLPVVSLTANGRLANFIIDTGASDVVLDPDFAAKIGVKPLSGETGIFAG